MLGYVRAFALGLATVLGVTAAGLMVLSLYWADDLADWRLPGLAALAAIACNTMLMIAVRARRRYPRMIWRAEPGSPPRSSP
jgi:hypothetical protein